MKVLFFHAIAGHPKVGQALMGQAATTLRPFSQFLGQAIHTAKERQYRYQLPWERVRNLLSIRLRPLDTLLRIPRRPPGIVITNWPADQEPDLNQPAFVVNRGLPVYMEAAFRLPQGLRVRAEKEILPTDRLVWCGVSCEIIRESLPPPPQGLSDLKGNRPRLLKSWASEDGEHCLLAVEGRLIQGGELLVDGEEQEAELLSPMEGLRRVFDSANMPFEVSGGMIRVEEPPAEGPLLGENALRYAWEVEERGARKGHWVQLLPPEDKGEWDEFLDPRAAFCEGEMNEVWTSRSHRPSEVYKVKKVDQDRYQLLLDRLPPQGEPLFLPIDLRNLYLQKRALRQLSEAPLPYHQGLLRLCEDPSRVRWPELFPQVPGKWYELRDESRSGTSEQRDFVAKALASPDFAFLEGPPGSGKTTAICEIVQQVIAQGKRVLLCASTHVAIDNVLERLLASDSPIDALRIGKLERVDDKVQQTQLDLRIEKMVKAWQGQPEMRGLGDGELWEMAERTVIMAANLTCGTTMGIVNHPLFRGRDEDLQRSERPITTMPHWDVLIVDEASKTLIQEFLVPALMARRWIIVGDVRQLPPFADRADIVANLRDLVDEKDRPIFARDHQRACLLLFRLLRRELDQAGIRWLIVEPPGVLTWIEKELEAEPVANLSVVRVLAKAGSAEAAIPWVTVDGLRKGASEALLLGSADWVLVGEDLLAQVSAYLPSNLLVLRELKGKAGGLGEGEAFWFRQEWWLARAAQLRRPYHDRKTKKGDIATHAQSQACESEWLQRNDLATEMAWRLTRLHELRRSQRPKECERLEDELRRLQPMALDISEELAEIQDIGLPSILEVLQEGIGEQRSKRRSALTLGLRSSKAEDFEARFESLSFQHRMHPDIASFSREMFYGGNSLKDANTIQSRDASLAWDFGTSEGRRVWADVNGREEGGVNGDEVRVVAGILREFIEWARRKGPPGRKGGAYWEVACLCFYVKQERALSGMLQELTGADSKTRFRVLEAPVEIVCGTVDRFQGREADLVMLSMRNTRRVGFLDSPNRLNVALTRARQHMVVVGHWSYFFSECDVQELKELAKRTPKVDSQTLQRWRRGR